MYQLEMWYEWVVHMLVEDRRASEAIQADSVWDLGDI